MKMAKMSKKNAAKVKKFLKDLAAINSVTHQKKILQAKIEKLEEETQALQDEQYELEQYDSDDQQTNLKNSIEDIGSAVPKKGAFTAYKQAETNIGDPVFITLSVPADAERVTPGNGVDFSWKSRVSKAKVVSMFLMDSETLVVTKKAVSIAYSKHDSNFIYKVGKVVTPKEDFEDTTENDCESGIHVFMHKHNALVY